jgi:hypothetical protein
MCRLIELKYSNQSNETEITIHKYTTHT